MNEYLQELEGIAKKKVRFSFLASHMLFLFFSFSQLLFLLFLLTIQDDENAMKEFVEFKATITKKIEELVGVETELSTNVHISQPGTILIKADYLQKIISFFLFVKVNQ